MNQTVQDLPSQPPAEPRIAVISAGWHAEIVAKGRESLLAELARQGWPRERIDLAEVPGAFEIPLLAQQLARRGQHAAIVGIGLVVDGGIYRHEFVAKAVIDGLMRVMLDTGVPVLSCVLTPQSFHEHREHQRFFAEHMLSKGAEAARACVQVLRQQRALLALEPAAA